MIIVTTLYNAEQYVEKCIGSIMGQSFSDFICYITDDLSTDNSIKLVEDLIQGDDRFILIKNSIKYYQTGNYDQIIRNNVNISDNEIIIEVDGDDWLPNSNTLQLINDIYKDENIWITNGSFRYSNGQFGFSSKQKINDNLRKAEMTCSHMRTWRAFLWRNIKEEDLKDDDGKYWSITGDLSFMFPMLEMATDEHYGFVKEITYIYNGENPINEHKVNLPLVNEIANKIRNKKSYEKLIR
jgi:glycosyltransferase involved in cell wall biosynthesis